MQRLFLGFILATTLTGQTGTANRKWESTVLVSVTADDFLKSQIISFTARELRSIQGLTVTLTESEHTGFVIKIAAVTYGDVAALAIDVNSPMKPLTHFIENVPMDNKNKAILTADLATGEIPYTLLIKMGPVKDLDRICKEIIATIDGDIFETNRSIMETYWKAKAREDSPTKP